MSYDDFLARQEARNEAPPEFAGVDPSEVASWAANGGTTPAQDAIASVANPIREDERTMAQIESYFEGLPDELPEPQADWEAEQYYEPEEEFDAQQYVQERVDEAVAGLVEDDPVVAAWQEEYDQRQAALRDARLNEQVQAIESDIDQELAASARRHDVNNAYKGGLSRGVLDAVHDEEQQNWVNQGGSQEDWASWLRENAETEIPRMVEKASKRIHDATITEMQLRRIK